MAAALNVDPLLLAAAGAASLYPTGSRAGTGAPQPHDLGDMTLLERNLTAQEAQLLTNCLHAAGVLAEAGDTGIVQTHSLLAIAVGGACIRVPQLQLAEAREVLEAFRRGEFDLGDDFDVGPSAG